MMTCQWHWCSVALTLSIPLEQECHRSTPAAPQVGQSNTRRVDIPGTVAIAAMTLLSSESLSSHHCPRRCQSRLSLRLLFPIITSLPRLSDEAEYYPSLADLLVTACYERDLPSAKAAVADGASVNEEGTARGVGALLPLAAAVFWQHIELVVWLLSLGADPNGDMVMWQGACKSTAGILQLLIDVGGDVNRESGGRPPLFPAVEGFNSEDNVRVLLAQPSLDLTIKSDGKTPEQYARARHRLALADVIAQEVSGGRSTVPSHHSSASHCVGVAVVYRSRDERRWYDLCCVRFNCACYAASLTGFAVVVTLRQSAQQVTREVELVDAASVARLVRVVLQSRCLDRAIITFVLTMCMLWW